MTPKEVLGRVRPLVQSAEVEDSFWRNICDAKNLYLEMTSSSNGFVVHDGSNGVCMFCHHGDLVVRLNAERSYPDIVLDSGHESQGWDLLNQVLAHMETEREIREHSL